MASIIDKCTGCGKDVAVAIGQSLANGKVMGWTAYHCSQCGAQVESDEAELPQSHRLAIMKTEGTWNLFISKKTTRALYALRKGLPISLNETGKLVLPGVVASGTKTEMELLCQQLARLSVSSELRKSSD